MRLFVVPAIYPNNVDPSSGSFVFEQTLELSKLGHDVVILDASEHNYRHWLRKSCRLISRTDDLAGINYKLHSRGLMTSRFPKRAVERSLRNVRKLYSRAVNENGKPDVIITHCTLPAGFAALTLAKEENIPCVIVEHYSLYLSDELHTYIKSELTGAVKDSTAFICVSESLKLSIERHTGITDKIDVISNMVDRRFTYSTPPEQPSFVFFSAGNLNKNKRFNLLIDSFCKAFSADDSVLLRIAGEGKERSKLERIVHENGRERQIQLLGWVPRDKIAEEYRSCHCFVLTSRKETFGIAYREAMATGRPVISTRNGGIEEGWENGNGIIAGAISSIPAALKHIKNDYCRFNGQEISRRCLTNCSPDAVINRLDKIISEAAENHISKGLSCMEYKSGIDSFPMPGWLIAEENTVQYRVPDELSGYSNRTGKYLIIYNPCGKFEFDHFLYQEDNYLVGTDGVLLNSKELLGGRAISELPEILLELGKRDAENFPALLRGPYCGFFCDLNEDKAIIYTNGVGDRPVYYYNGPSERIAASDLNILIEFCKKNGKKLSVGRPAVFSLLQYGFTVDTFTMAAEISRVFPGACLIWERDGNAEHRYHRLDNEEWLQMTEEEAIDGLDEMFSQAVKRSFDKDDEYGYRHLADISGGMDSRMVNWVAHDLGYGNTINICYGLPSCVDYNIASKISAELGNDFLFYSLSNGRFLLDLDETVWKNFGTAIYCGPTGALNTIKALDTENIGIRHNGNMGDTIFGAYIKGKTHRPSGDMSGCNYSKFSYEGISTDNSRYENEEIQKLYARYLLADPASHFLVRDKVVAYSPFMDIDFLDFFLHIPIKYRSGRLYANWVSKKYPKASRYHYNSRVFRITDNRKLAYVFSSGSKRLQDIGQKTLYAMKLSRYEYRMAGMNPIEAIFERSSQAKNFFYSYFTRNIGLFDGCPDIKTALQNEYYQGNATEKALVLTVMSFIKQHGLEL